MKSPWPPPDQPVRVIKIGGSLITDRSRRASFHQPCVDSFAASLAALRSEGELDDFVLVLGGGSFAHDIVHEHQINQPNWRNVNNFYELPASLYHLQSLVTQRLCAAGLAAAPLQTTSWLYWAETGHMAFAAPLQAAVANQMIPVLTGGWVFDHQRRVRIISSDWLPVAVNSCMPVRDVTVLTDQPGIREAMDSDRIHRAVTATNFKTVRQSLHGAQRTDVTGAMRGKFDALLELARLGVRSTIGGGRDISISSLRDLLSDSPSGTVFLPWPQPKANCEVNCD